MDTDKLKVLKQARARKLGTLTRTRRRAFILIEAKGSRTELTQILKELDVNVEAVHEAHDQYTAQLQEKEDIKSAEVYIEDVEKQYSEAVERIREHLNARKDEPPSVASVSGRSAGHSRASERSEVTKAREAEIRERLKELELTQMQQRLDIEQQEQELKRKRTMQEASDAHQRATLEASLQKAALDDLQWERRDDFKDSPVPGKDVKETRSKKYPDADIEDKGTSGRCCAGLSKSVPKISLPQFSGNSLDWPQWFGLFSALVDKQENLSETEKMVHLQASVTGLAKKTIAGFMYNPDLYQDALSVLQERFGRQKDIVRAHLGALFGAQRLTASSAAALEEFYTTVNCTVTVLQSLHCDGDLQSHENLQRVIQKLPADLRREWSRYEIDMEPSSPSLATFSKWLGGQVKVALNCIVPGYQSEERRTPSKRVTLATSTGRETCGCCDGDHHLGACGIFTSWPVNDRAQFVADRGLCFVCLQHGHLIRTCRWAKPCGRDGCTMRHHQLLHGSSRVVRRQWPAVYDREHEETVHRVDPPNDRRDPTQAEAAVRRTVATSFPEVEDSETLLQIVQVRIHGSDGAFEDVLALLDPGSQTSLCTADVLTSLQISGSQADLCLQNVEGSGSPQNSRRVKLTVSPRNADHAQIEVPEAFSVPRLNVKPPQIPAEERCKWEHTLDLHLPDYKGAEIKLLLGANVIEAVLQQEVRVGKPGQPVAVKTAFGWTLTGTVKGLIPGRLRQVMFIRKAQQERDLSSAVEEWWKTESFGVRVDKLSARSLDEDRAEKIMRDTTKMVEEGRYETGLLWKRDGVRLPDNRSMALQRLQQLEKGLLRQPEKAAQYQKIIEGYLEQGFARKIPEEELMQYHPRRWYLPHHGVSNPNKPGKLRLVFDAAASYRGTSLNDELLTGPDMLLSLPGVLLRFREEAVAIVGDIEKMYHQVRVIQPDQPALSFLWRDLNTSKAPETLQMTVTIFGARCSPASANYVLCKTALDHQEDTPISRRAASAVQRNVYMDDLLRSEKTGEDAKATRREVTKLVSKGGFRLTKWRSNAEEVIMDVPESERADQSAERPTESVLGCPWDPVEDTLGVRAIEVKDLERVTKRLVVSTVARLFDPLGLAAPFALQAKLLVQKIWTLGLGWDEQLRDEERRYWDVWVAELRKLRDLVVPRCLHLSRGDGEMQHEVHIFCDASELAFGTVAYLRTERDGGVDVGFIAAKTRVAPLKQISIVRLELQAAVMATRLAEAISRELTYEVHRTVFWSDSCVVLQYLNNESRRFHTFVANRVAEIRESSEPSQWKKVPTDLNPADVCSRGQSVTWLLMEPSWVNGPDFLRREEDEWPAQSATEVLSSSDPEVRMVCVTAVRSTSSEYLPDAARFSSWLKYNRAVAWMIRFVRNLQAKSKSDDQQPTVGPLTAAELQAAELVTLRDVQRRHFDGEARCLREGSPVQRSSRIRNLSPFVDGEGILRVGGRLGHAPLAFASRHPAILPSADPVTHLIIAHAHQRVLHSGMERTLTEVRLRYWPCRGRSLVKHVIHKCQLCKRRRCRPQTPKMADLPASRFDESRAFSTVGVDYFGPMEVKKFRKTEKRYGVLFTCCATRAVHLELAHSLDTDSFLLALRRFTARRGSPKTLMSDNGTNFVGAERELKQSLAEWEQSRIVDELSQKGIEWVFIPPGAPHMGGIWERLVGSVKRALKMVVGNSCLTDEVLYTILTEVESMLNGRPLTYVSTDGRDVDPLTPNHLLLGCANANLSPGRFQDREVNSRRRWRQAQTIADHFWNRWRREYLPTLMARSKWLEDTRNLKIGDVVLMAEDTAPRGFWPLARVTQVFTGSDGRVRSAELTTASGSHYHRPVTKICVLEEVPE